MPASLNIREEHGRDVDVASGHNEPALDAQIGRVKDTIP
jgi:hypothetical protein